MAFVVPGDVADADVPSGGNVYDQRMCAALGLEARAVGGTWPTPDDDARTELARTLRDLPDGTTVLLDGLVACGVPEVVVPEADRLRVAVLVHMPLADETGRDPAVAADLNAREKETLRAAAAVIATSRWSGRRLVEHHGLPVDRVHVASPGVDPAPVATGTGGRLLCVAAVTPRKAQDVLTAALADLKDLPWTCECVGPLARDPEFVVQLRGLIALHGLTDRILLAGPKSGDPLEAAYAQADLLVLPSHGETYGMVITEALARGIPVFVSAVNAGPDTLGQAPDGSVPGMAITPGDPAELAAALRRFLTEPDFHQRLRASALARRSTLTGWDTTARLLGEVLSRLETGAVCAA
ncbi:glycosyltransferase family 4 protein [Actinocrispum wychmicini]|uniref:glycosyltransferase family 4 protein n=1 Tax=Actinocrispum wychmicini TaxID=1213861 RepID=UPI001FB593FA|nr:glycosyltransferase family 4 protein [Actinocrispum wychmicini]